MLLTYAEQQLLLMHKCHSGLVYKAKACAAECPATVCDDGGQATLS